MTHKYKGKEYEVQTGAKGGQFFVDDTGKKHYLKSATPKKTTKKKSTEAIKKEVESTDFIKRYVCYYSRYKDGEMVDDFKEWTDAKSYNEAKEYFENEYRHDENVKIELITKE